MVRVRGTGTSERKGGGGSGNGIGRGEWRVRARTLGGNGQETKIWCIQQHIKYILGIESSVFMDSVLGL